MAKHLLRRFGVESSFYDPLIGDGITEHFRDTTKLVWCENPGSLTMEVQDVPAIVKAAHSRNILVALDNTWASGVLFRAFDHGVDISAQALTKYIGGHSDLLLGAVTVKNRELYEKLGQTHYLLGCAASPDDCSLAIRGLKTLSVRLKQIEKSALAVAKWLRGRIEVDRVLHPALPSCPGYEIWERDFKGSSGLFSIVFKPGPSKQQVEAFVDALKLFEIGYSWGGVTSLAMSYDLTNVKGRPKYDHRLVRLYVGLEDPEDLIVDLEQALRKLTA
jgi:cystathionine beta-lyase